MMRVVQWQIQLEVIYKPLGHFLILSYSLRAILQNKTYEVIKTFGYYPLPPSMSMWFIDDPLLYLCGILILDLWGRTQITLAEFWRFLTPPPPLLASLLHKLM